MVIKMNQMIDMYIIHSGNCHTVILIGMNHNNIHALAVVPIVLLCDM